MTVNSPRIIVTLWKPYRPVEDVEKIISSWISETDVSPQNRYIALPYTYLKTLSSKLASFGVVLGSDFLDPVEESSFTGSIASRLLKDAGARFVIVGTAESRRKFGESNLNIRDKIKRAANDKLIPFLCVGESSEDFTSGKSKEFLSQQLKECIDGLTLKELTGLTIVYEAPWMDKHPYKPNEDDLSRAYDNFNSALKEAIDAKIIPTLHLIYAYPYDLDHLPVYFQSHEASGYFFEKPIHYSDLTAYELHDDLKKGLKIPRESIASPGILEQSGSLSLDVPVSFPENIPPEEEPKVVMSEEQINTVLDESISPVGEQIVKKKRTKITKEEVEM